MNDPSAANDAHTQRAADTVEPAAVAAMSATLDYDRPPLPGEPLPHLWHWIFFRPTVPQSQIAHDGHPKKGGFLPDLGLPRRMWAGGRLRFLAPLSVGSAITRESTIVDIAEKQGRTGRLGFVTVNHKIWCEGMLAIDEEHDIVYREPAAPGSPAASPVTAPDHAQWHRDIVPDEVLMFRYSALTFNAHRIHYDKPYATQTEGYPNLVVHGPLIATLLMDLLRRQRPAATVLDFSYKAMRPSFAGNVMHLCGRPSADGRTVELWSKDHEGWLTMSAHAMLA
ncbi:MaoC family dehydratase N-terminal domain-containing protein [Paraburkholderia bengalensis]|uniref:MaoC family dehydratase N-terminal domain-containing protein n=1 Tax=Paraburkholderia bengalensis TaxID=2747562 RepID=A0ABU8ILX9_9BURK